MIEMPCKLQAGNFFNIFIIKYPNWQHWIISFVVALYIVWQQQKLKLVEEQTNFIFLK